MNTHPAADIPVFRFGRFKDFREDQELPIKPITLIYGPNSAGKSSAIQSMLLVAHILRGGSIDTACVDAAPGAIDLGGVDNFTYRKNKTNPVKVGFDLPAGEWIGLRSPPAEETGIQSIDHVFGGNKGKELLLHGGDTLSCSCQLRSGFSLSINGKLLVQFDILPHFDLAGSAMDISPYPEGLPIPLRKMAFQRENSEWSCHLAEADMDHSAARSWISSRYSECTGRELDSDLWAKACEMVREHFETRMWIKGIIPSISSWDNHFDPNETMVGESSIPREIRRIFALFEDFLFRLIQALRLRTTDLLGSPVYLGPLRSYTGRTALNLSPSAEVGARFDQSAQFELLSNSGLLESVNRWMETRLGLLTPYKLVVRRFFESEAKRKSYNRSLKQFEGRQDPLAQAAFRELNENSGAVMEIAIKDIRSGVFLSQKDVGVGISQVLPILIAALGERYRMHLIEQPELHLHPAHQAELADLFIESAMGETQNCFLIETHSEHILLRIMRRIRECESGKITPGIPPITSDDVSVVYVEPTNDGSVLRQMKLNAKGELVNDWPGGFFEEGLREMLM